MILIASIPLLVPFVSGCTVPSPPMTMRHVAHKLPTTRAILRRPMCSTVKMTKRQPTSRPARLIMVPVKGSITAMRFKKIVPYVEAKDCPVAWLAAEVKMPIHVRRFIQSVALNFTE